MSQLASNPETEKGDVMKGDQVYADAHSVEETHFSVGDVLRGTAERAPTPFERKAALINACVF